MMKRGRKFLLSAAVLTVAACGGEQANLKVRSIPTPLAQGAKPVSFRIAEARGQLALGNVALALEGFRKAWRDDPNSIDALAGMATCYDRMGRFDLSRRNYETALAIEPANVQLLGAFSQSLQLQGQLAEARQVRAEITQRLAARSATETPELIAHAPAPAPLPEIAAHRLEAGSLETTVPMRLAGAEPLVPEEAVVDIPISRPALAATRAHVSATRTPQKNRLSIAAPVLPEPTIMLEAAATPQGAEARPAAATGTSVTLELPPARRVQGAEYASTAPAFPAAGESPSLNVPPRAVPKPTVVGEEGPRLERLSLAEIGLITAPGPTWRSTTVAQTAVSTKIRFVPLRQASTYPVSVRLLNAARVNRLAARTRNWLIARGWRGLAIGDAPATRMRSVIYYPADKRVLAQRLAAQFGFAMAPRSSGTQITVLLGSDAARHPSLRPRRA